VTTDRRVRVLALLPFSEEAASVRFRVAQFVPSLAAAGFDLDLRPLFDTALFRLLYRPGHVTEKASALVSRTVERVQSLRGDYDVALVHREAYPIGSPFIERWLARRVPVIYDFDDAIYLPNNSDANKMVGFLKRPNKVDDIIRVSTEVIAGNAHLGQYARAHGGSRVSVIPTVVDTSVWAPPTRPVVNDPPVIGWIGTPTTTVYLLELRDVFTTLAAEHAFTLRVSGASGPVNFPGVRVDNRPWVREHEVELFNTCDIGVYPLPANEWTLGKCGFKAIQFMACGVPVVASPVGVNSTIIDDGHNGLLVHDPAQWLSHLRALLGDAAMRRRIGGAGRERIESAYSLRAAAPSVVSVFERASKASHAVIA
jgi:glycosyltransferase involved in cell wall biosynthesis